MKPTCNWTGIVESIAAAARATGKTPKTLRAWRAEGRELAGFLADGRVDLGKLSTFANARTRKRDGSSKKKEAELFEKIRKLKLANDRTEGKLIERALARERIQRMFADINAARLKSEAEHPTRFAAAAGDVAACRTIVRGIWDDILTDMNKLQRHFE